MLGEIRRLTRFVSQYETQFAKLMMGFTQKVMESERKQVQLELSRAKACDCGYVCLGSAQIHPREETHAPDAGRAARQDQRPSG